MDHFPGGDLDQFLSGGNSEPEHLEPYLGAKVLEMRTCCSLRVEPRGAVDRLQQLVRLAEQLDLIDLYPLELARTHTDLRRKKIAGLERLRSSVQRLEGLVGIEGFLSDGRES